MTAKRQLIVLGVDALDSDLLQAFGPSLPHMSELTEVRYWPMFPPDSVPAWATIQTGLPAERHGLVTSGDYLRLSVGADGTCTSPLKGRTFYDRASEAGKKVVVVNPFLAYPAWPLAGLMVSGPAFAIGGQVDTWPREAATRWGGCPIGGLTADPTRRTRLAFMQQSIAEISELGRRFLNELRGQDWDCAFLTLLSLDRIEHFFWRFCDKSDPDYPGPTVYEKAIEVGYAAVDAVVGTIRQAFPEAAILVLGDHGHSRRPKQLFEVAEWLRRRGLLHAAPVLSSTAMVERAKRTVVTTLSRLHLEDLTRLLAKAVPRAAELKNSSFAVSKSQSLVEVCPFGRNSFGGLRVNRTEPAERRELLEQLAADLGTVISPSGERIVRSTRIVERSEADRSSGLADLEMELHPGFGVGTDLYGGLFSVSPYRRHISGGHAMSAAMLYGGPIRATNSSSTPTVGTVDIAPTVLALLGIEHPDDLPGMSFLDWQPDS